MKKYIILVGIVSLCLKINAQISAFDSSTEGWTTIGDNNPTIFQPTGGNPNGYIKHNDVSNNQTWYWIAPSIFLGNKSSSIGKYFCFDFKTSHLQSQTYNDLNITGNGITIYNDINPSFTWTHYSFLIDINSGWKKDSASQSVLASFNDIQTVFSNISQIKIRGEYSTATDVGSLDNVSLCQPKDTTLNFTACQGDTILGYSATGTYIDTFHYANCCDSIRTINLTLSTQSSSNSNASICSNQIPFSWNGQSITTSGTYTDTTINAVGCDSIATLILTVHPTSSSTTTALICANQIPYLWNGQNITASGNYSFSTTNSVGCDSVATLILTIKPTSSSTNSQSVCSNQLPYLWNGQNLTSGGTYTYTTTNAAGCDSVATLNLSITNTVTNTIYQTACDSYTWPINGTAYTSSGTYIATSLNANGCLQTDSLILTINNSSLSSTSVTACNAYTWPINGITYTTSGNYFATSTNANGCQHTDSLLLSINYSSSNSITITACNSCTWSVNNTTYTTSGTYTNTSTNANGCPQYDTLILTINNSTSSSTTQTACNAYTWPINNTTYSLSGTHTYTSINANGCPQYDTLLLTINYNTSNTLAQTQCNSYTWPVNNTNYTLSGIYTNTSTNTNGCLQYDTLLLTINNSTSSSTSQSVCNSYTWPVNGTTYTSSGMYTNTSTNTNGCPQYDTLLLTVNYSTSTSTSVTACDAYLWNGITYTISGTYTNLSTNANGCPQTDSLLLTINNSTSSSTSQTTCDSYTWPVNGITYTTSGNFISTSLNANGCTQTDSLILTINNSSSSSTIQTVCDSYFWNGLNYFNSGTYSYGPVPNSKNCDSIATLVLNIQSSSSLSMDTTICSGETYEGHASSGTYTDTLINSFGCDSIYTLNLTVLPSPVIQLQVSNNNPCLGDTVTLTCTGAIQYSCQTNAWYEIKGNIIKIKVDASTIIEVNGIDSNGCQTFVTHSFNLVPCCKLFVPNAFTPNGDGVNDDFVVLPDGDAQIEDVSVFNRWGQLVFKGKSTLGWDSKFKGIEQDMGTYFYLIKYKCYGQEKYEKGDLLLIR